jgi:hypothetical protein
MKTQCESNATSAACNDRRCSDYDDECAQVEDPLSCWVGVTVYHEGEIYYTPISDGYCPMLRKDKP